VPQNPFDKASRFAAKLDPPGFLAWLLNLPPGRFEFRGWLDTRGIPPPAGSDTTGDTVARLADPGSHGTPWAVAVEFQTVPDPEMFGRLLGYLSALWLGAKPDAERGSRFHVGAAVVNLTGGGVATRRMEWPAAELTTHLQVVERNLEREPAADLLAAVESGARSRALLPWVPLLAGGDEVAVAERWKRAAEAEADGRRRAEYAGLARVFASAARRQDFWKAQLEGWNVTESSVVNEWIAEGEAKGRAEGRREERVAALLDVLTDRFGPPPADLEAAVRAAADVAQLRAWTTAAVKAATLDDFRRAAGV
jgi:hypothetical protein